MIAIVDAGPLYATAIRHDRQHRSCSAVLQREDLEVVVPALVITEVSYLLNKRFGARSEAAFLRAVAEMEVEAPTSDDLESMADLVERYRDFPLGAADAFVAVLAERLKTDVIITLDRRHFGALRTRDGRPFTLLPE